MESDPRREPACQQLPWDLKVRLLVAFVSRFLFREVGRKTTLVFPDLGV